MQTSVRPTAAINSSFRLLWTATSAANLGDGIGLVVISLLAASLTRDPLAIAAVAAAQRLPWLLFDQRHPGAAGAGAPWA